ncbi:DHH family phosphoesterase [Mariprofundus sp. KV]|uniref:DHH family phosphoesterase n=1 Tax=Mariprofundus sp. KV TaxID=2608715 RepID=UPI0015A0A7BF|nr:DHH family phosphoesterase [Mariprofundus sp. KV]NWF35239.1 DHH family phosphoesterase [Mariprofundus sp. KV]
MTCFDIFNGDADGICALHQLRLSCPRKSELVTGVKRDISLLKKVEAQAGDKLTVLDISLDKNRDDLLRLLDAGAELFYCDHHFAGEIPTSDRLQARIDTSADTCTSLLVNSYLDGAHLPWAVTAAFGDNLFDSARAAAAPLKLSDARLSQLEQLGTLINYNGYGVTPEDLHFHPADLYRAISPYADPFAFIAESADFARLAEGYEADMAQARNLTLAVEEEYIAVVVLQDAPWTRRVSGVYGNELARQYPDRAHALLTALPGGEFRISVRAPLNNKTGADELCMMFPTGGGRKAAAGINALPAAMYDAFIDAFREKYEQ